jgi:hypothetical protein
MFTATRSSSAPLAPPITVGQLAGTWFATLSGVTGCGTTTLAATFTLDSTGNGTQTSSLQHTAACRDIDLSGQTVQVQALNANGSGFIAFGWRRLRVRIRFSGDQAVRVRASTRFVSGHRFSNAIRATKPTAPSDASSSTPPHGKGTRYRFRWIVRRLYAYTLGDGPGENASALLAAGTTAAIFATSASVLVPVAPNAFHGTAAFHGIT